MLNATELLVDFTVFAIKATIIISFILVTVGEAFKHDLVGWRF